MATKRTPLQRFSKPGKITPKAIEIFKRMQALPKCTCIPPPPERYWERISCISCEAWWDLHGPLHKELVGETPFCWPVIADPDDDYVCDGKHDPGAMYRELQRLSGRTCPTFWDRRGI